jgi:hypothetical protein
MEKKIQLISARIDPSSLRLPGDRRLLDKFGEIAGRPRQSDGASASLDAQIPAPTQVFVERSKGSHFNFQQFLDLFYSALQ